jgi:NAD(P)-dependent dehydrogenase (short-subunit alcohol dehydrogenase family)
MVIRLTGKTAVVTGSTSGIGYAIAKGLAEAGASVVVNGRAENRVAAAIQRLENEVPAADVKGTAADLAGAAGTGQLIAAVPQADILVNNLGIFGPKPFFEITDEDWEHSFALNVMSAV